MDQFKFGLLLMPQDGKDAGSESSCDAHMRSPVLLIDGGSSTGSASVGHGAELLIHGCQDWPLMVVGGTDRPTCLRQGPVASRPAALNVQLVGVDSGLCLAPTYKQQLLVTLHNCDAGALQLTAENFDKTIASTELVFLNFYADWCRFSNMLEPIWDEGADMVTKKLDSSRVLMAKVDCDKEEKLSDRFHISKYPTLKLIRNGQPAKKEYRGQRSAESFLKFLEEEIRDPVRVINSTDQLKEEKKGQVIGYFKSPDSPAYRSFMKMAKALKDECIMIAGFGEEFRVFRPDNYDMVVVRKPSSLEDVALPSVIDVMSTDRMTGWARRICVPLVREITFENAEELTEEGLPFLILFHTPEDSETPKKFLQFVEDNLYEEKDGINFLTADGITFAHPLHHLGKAKSDLPLIAIDSFRHMYVFPDIKDMETRGKLKEFIDDLHSGKLHREFHYGPSKPQALPPGSAPTTAAPTSPPESVFKKLGPSGNRYSLLKDEL